MLLELLAGIFAGMSKGGIFERVRVWYMRTFKRGKKRTRTPKVPKADQGAMPSLQERIEAEENLLLSMTRRQYILEAFVRELDRVTRMKETTWWNGSLWLVMLDFRDQNVTHFGSWAKSMYSPGGLLSHVNGIPLKRRKHDRAREKRDPHYAGLLEQGHQQALQRLFPGATGEHPKSSDVQALRDRFQDRMRDVVADRNANRAHPYERDAQEHGKARMLNFAEMRDLIDYATDLLNDLRLLNHGSTLHYADMCDTPSDAFAEDLVDSLVLGASFRVEVVRAGKDRDQFYADLHARHDALDDAKRSTLRWNDNFPEDLA